jgi:hypothetical protein
MLPTPTYPISESITFFRDLAFALSPIPLLAVLWVIGLFVRGAAGGSARRHG